MKPFSLSLLCVALLWVLSACGHTAMRGSIVMKVDAEDAHVCLGNGEVKVGDKVALFDNICDGRKTNEKGHAICSKEKIGVGTVTEILNEHYSVIHVGPGVAFKEGTTVEKL